MKLTHYAITKEIDWDSLADDSGVDKIGTSFTDERGITYIYGDVDNRWVIIKLGSREVARLGRGMTHGMIYLTGHGIDAMEIHNEILRDNGTGYSVGVDSDNTTLAVYHDGRLLQELNAYYDGGTDVLTGSVFFQRVYGHGVYSFYPREHQTALYVALDIGVDVYGIRTDS